MVPAGSGLGGFQVGSIFKLRGFAMRISRHFTVEDHSPYEGISFRQAVSEIRNPDGSIVFHQDGIEVPEAWSQVAASGCTAR